MSAGLLLYGPPASGKDTVTAALTATNQRFHLYRRMKLGPGRTTGYRMTTEDAIEQLSRSEEIVWENERYGARYVIDRPSLVQMLDQDFIPIVHAGQPEVITAVRSAMPDSNWTVAELWCPREVARSRIISRATGDLEARLIAWDATPRLVNADLQVDTATVTPSTCAARILHAMGPL